MPWVGGGDGVLDCGGRGSLDGEVGVRWWHWCIRRFSVGYRDIRCCRAGSGGGRIWIFLKYKFMIQTNRRS